MKNSQYLKQYVQNHPENKMAWYLLGKEYYKNGQEGKANYCFNEAGEVYEAFEHSKIPSEMLREYEEGLLKAGRQRDMNRQKVRRLLLGLMFLLLLFTPTATAPGSYVNEESGSMPKGTSASDAAVPPDKMTPDAVSSEQPEILFTAREAGEGSSSGNELTNLLKKSKGPSYTAVLSMQRSGKWLLWKEKLPLDYTLEKTGNGGAVYQSYDPAACACQPPDSGELTVKAAQWQVRQQELAVLWSAMRAFNNSKGRLPASLKELAGSFPGNWLAGTTPGMKQAFIPLKNAAVSMKGQVLPADSASNSDAEIPFLTEPLTIIVDKQRHRLAVTSGSIILRNYEVGLGGDKTPEGGFVISDKVVNPNGRDNGEFGSRGMQLSDSNYAIHGTNETDSIGKDESLGCIRMNRKDVEELFALVPMGTKVEISKGVLPSALLLPKKRFSPPATQNQTNPRKVYHWLN
ncbi:L,D-transpeptidase [Paenibacillus sp. BR2-3]|uniref:L,D-transpeptidase n=1 Tax=Paenibacillus sp. BR2-3 TaxID=3048494 RepID=UPI00397785A7